MSGYIDLETWNQREHHELFRDFAQPFFSTCVELDVTAAWRRSRQSRGPSFFLTAVFAALHAANAIEPFRLRLRADGVWKHDRIIMSTTVLRDDDTFGFALLEPLESYDEFEQRGREAMRAARDESGLPRRETDDAVVFHSTLPWIRFTSFSNALPLRGESIPRIVFGKCSEDRDGRMTMPVAVEVHHALVHGIDVARFLELLQGRLDEPQA